MLKTPEEAQLGAFLPRDQWELFSYARPEEVSSVVLGLFCFSEAAIEPVRVVTGVSRNALRGECLHLQLQSKNSQTISAFYTYLRPEKKKLQIVCVFVREVKNIFTPK